MKKRTPAMPCTSPAFADKYGPWALVTGASSGIGAQFCRSLAARGLNVILVARRVDRLNALADELQRAHDVKTLVVAQDLAAADAAERVAAAVVGLDVGLLVNNAGVSTMGMFVNEAPPDVAKLMAVNNAAVAALASTFGRDLARRGRGGMVFVSSLAARPSPYWAAYSASKAFVSTLALSMRYELLRYGVDVLAFEPGMVHSEASERAKEVLNIGKMGFHTMDTEVAVEKCLKALGKKGSYTPGVMNKMFKAFQTWTPYAVNLNFYASVMRKATPEERTKLAE